MGEASFQTFLGIYSSNPCAIRPYFSLSCPKFFRRLLTVLAVCATCNDGMTLRTGTSKNGPAHRKQYGMLYECCTPRVSGGDLRDQNYCYVPNIVILNSLERVKGIEPSYSAWKAAALPLSYTRARPINYHATEAASTAMRRFGVATASAAALARPGPLTCADSVPILMFPSTTKGGDSVSYTKRCHLAGITR